MASQLTPRAGIGERLAALIRIATVSSGPHAHLESHLEQLRAALAEHYPRVFAELEVERVAPRGLLLQWAGAEASLDPLVLMAHLDVVPADEQDGWRHPPFAGVVEDGWVHGRGALDDKGPLVVILEAVENLLAAGVVPRRGVILAFGGDEEVYGDSASAMARLLQDRGITPALVLDEGGAVVERPLPFVPAQTAMIGLAEKGVVSLVLTAAGDPGHASTPGRDSAVRRLTRALDRLGPGTFTPQAPSSVLAMLRALADLCAPATARGLRALAASPRLAGRVLASRGGEPAALVRTTIAVTQLAAGSSQNVLPSQASATLNLRIIPGESADAGIERIRRRIADPRITVEVLEASDPSPQSDADGPAFAQIATAVAAAFPQAAPVPYVMMQASDARHFHRRFDAVFRFAPLEMSAEQRGSIHGVDERVEIASLERGEVFHRALILAEG